MLLPTEEGVLHNTCFDNSCFLDLNEIPCCKMYKFNEFHKRGFVAHSVLRILVVCRLDFDSISHINERIRICSRH